MSALLLAQVSEPFIRWGYSGDHLGLLWSALVQHLELTFIAVSVGFFSELVVKQLASLTTRFGMSNGRFQASSTPYRRDSCIRTVPP